MPNILKLTIRCLAILLLAAASIVVAEGPAMAFPLKQYVTQSQLAAHCNAAGGTSGASANGEVYWCTAPNGNEVSCTNSKTSHLCSGSTALTSNDGGSNGAGTTIPCDPFLCKIFCRGRPNCTFGGELVKAIPAKVQDFSAPPSLVTPVPGGGTGTPAPVGVPSP